MFRLMPHYESGLALVMESLGDPTIYLKVVSLNDARVLARINDSFWAHWNGTNREKIKETGASIYKSTLGWVVSVPRQGVFDAT